MSDSINVKRLAELYRESQKGEDKHLLSVAEAAMAEALVAEAALAKMALAEALVAEALALETAS